MRRRKRRIWLPTALVLVCLALGWLIYQQHTMSPNTEAFANSSTDPVIDLGVLPPEREFSMVAIEEFEAVLERPLFSPERRPPVRTTAPAPIVARGFNYALKGVLINDSSRIALLRRDSDGQIIRLRKGEELDGWVLEEVKPDSIVVDQAGKKHYLELTFDIQPTAERPSARRDKDDD